MQKKTALLGAAVLIAGAAAITPNLVSAYQGDPSVKGPSYTAERHETMTKSFENNDFNSWKEQMEGKGRVIEMVNEENFARFAEAHKLAAEGDLEGSKKIREELGLGLRNGSGEGSHKENRTGERNGSGRLNK